MMRLSVSFTVSDPDPNLVGPDATDEGGIGSVCHVSDPFDVDHDSPAVLAAIQAAVDELEDDGVCVDQGGSDDEETGDFIYELDFPDFQADSSNFRFVDDLAKSLIANIAARLAKI